MLHDVDNSGHFFLMQGGYVERDNVLRKEVVNWCREHLGKGCDQFGGEFEGNHWVINAHNDVWVSNDDHALEFRLRWC